MVSETNEGENEEKGRKLCKKVTMQTSVDCASGGEGMLLKKNRTTTGKQEAKSECLCQNETQGESGLHLTRERKD